jgi:hypothetical protein
MLEKSVRTSDFLYFFENLVFFIYFFNIMHLILEKFTKKEARFYPASFRIYGLALCIWFRRIC